jgi:hypothetical protein
MKTHCHEDIFQLQKLDLPGRTAVLMILPKIPIWVLSKIAWITLVTVGSHLWNVKQQLPAKDGRTIGTGRILISVE